MQQGATAALPESPLGDDPQICRAASSEPVREASREFAHQAIGLVPCQCWEPRLHLGRTRLGGCSKVRQRSKRQQRKQRSRHDDVDSSDEATIDRPVGPLGP
jgi:hypothetical protein